MSRLDPVKNLEGLIDAVAILRGEGRVVELDVAGGGPQEYLNSLMARVTSHGLERQVRWCGHVSGQEKVKLLAVADVFVLPSHSENFGVSVLEAMAAGLPCVLGRGVALANPLEEAGGGIAVDPSGEAIAAGLREYLDSPETRFHAGDAARHLVEREYSIETMASRLTGLYESVSVQDRKP